MKKTIALILVLVLCLGLCACSAPLVENKLQGEWEGALGTVYTFSDGEFTFEAFVAGVSIGTIEGTYEVHDSMIELDFDLGLDLGIDSELEYTYEKGELEIEGLTKRD